jgi:hypothetical protein
MIHIAEELSITDLFLLHRNFKWFKQYDKSRSVFIVTLVSPPCHMWVLYFLVFLGISEELGEDLD